MATVREIRDFLALAPEVPVFDVRSEGEYAHGHIPGAVSLPLFNNVERAEIGTLYKQQGKQPAILRGLEIVGPKMHSLARMALERAHDGQVAVHCWRGGMRSGSVAWLFERVGLDVITLKGGYKSYRRFALALFAAPRRYIVVGGKTGSQKTRILHELAGRGAAVIDLEALANHRGSAFGYAPSEWQPTQEQFENDLALQLARLPGGAPVFIEDESKLIGRMHIPHELWKQMRSNRVYVLDWPLEARVAFLAGEYTAENEVILSNLKAIGKRLGLERLKHASEALEAGDRAEVCRIVLDYYDRAYTYGLSQRAAETISYLPGENAVEELLRIAATH